MASYGRDFGGARGWFDRWFGGGGRGGYDRGYGSSGGRGYDRSFGRGYDRGDYRGIPPWGRPGRDEDTRGIPQWGRAGREGGYAGPRGGGYFNPGYMVDEAWGGAFARGDAQFQGRRMYGDDYRPMGRPGYGGGYDRPFRGGGGGYGSPGGWRAFGRGYDRGR